MDFRVISVFWGLCSGSIDQYWLLPWQDLNLCNRETSGHVCKRLSGWTDLGSLSKRKSELSASIHLSFPPGEIMWATSSSLCHSATVLFPKWALLSVCEPKLAFSSFVRHFVIAPRTVTNIWSMWLANVLSPQSSE